MVSRHQRDVLKTLKINIISGSISHNSLFHFGLRQPLFPNAYFLHYNIIIKLQGGGYSACSRLNVKAEDIQPAAGWIGNPNPNPNPRQLAAE